MDKLVFIMMIYIISILNLIDGHGTLFGREPLPTKKFITKVYSTLSSLFWKESLKTLSSQHRWS